MKVLFNRRQVPILAACVFGLLASGTLRAQRPIAPHAASVPQSIHKTRIIRNVLYFAQKGRTDNTISSPHIHVDVITIAGKPIIPLERVLERAADCLIH